MFQNVSEADLNKVIEFSDGKYTIRDLLSPIDVMRGKGMGFVTTPPIPNEKKYREDLAIRFLNHYSDLLKDLDRKSWNYINQYDVFEAILSGNFPFKDCVLAFKKGGIAASFVI